MIELAWHGSASVSLRLAGVEILVDPHFTPEGVYGPWYVPNPRAPAWDDYLTRFEPAFVWVTHGHFDHFDIEAARVLAGRTGATFVGSPDVTATLARHVGLGPDRLLPVEAGRPARLATVTCTPVEGVHWFTGEEGRRAAARFEGRPDRWGVMPCGGPMLGFIAEVPGGAADGPGIRTVYVSGDTTLEGIPHRRVHVAVVNVGGDIRNPVTKMPEKCIVDVPDLVAAARDRLRPEVLVPVHWDAPTFLSPTDIGALTRELGALDPPVRVVVPPYHAWTPL